MSDQTKGGIAWTDTTWNPIRGCKEVSPGCANCYAKGVAARFSGPGFPYEGLATRTAKGKPMWTGTFATVHDHMLDPLRWTRARRIFVNSMSDLFGEGVPDYTIDQVMGVMLCCVALAPGTRRGAFRPGSHIFQSLTKRADRQRAYFASRSPREHVLAWAQAAQGAGVRMEDEDLLVEEGLQDEPEAFFPLPNLHLGVSIEAQPYAGRALDLIATPAAVRWISYEPALGPLDLGLLGTIPKDIAPRHTLVHEAIDWIVIGGESGPNARPFNVAWARSLIQETRGLNTRVFVKQLGRDVRTVNDDNLTGGRDDDPPGWDLHPDDVEENLGGHRDDYQGAPVRVHLRHPKGGDTSEWPADLRVREWPGDTTEETKTP